jgi:asparagine synthase (glutamine-hydrolysing)
VTERMRLSIRHEPWYADRYFEDRSGLIACGCVSVRDRASVSRSGQNGLSTVVMLDGEIYDHATRRRDLEAAGYAFGGNQCEEILAFGLDRWGDAFLTDLEGYFSAAVWRSADQTLLLITDRFGMKPL